MKLTGSTITCRIGDSDKDRILYRDDDGRYWVMFARVYRGGFCTAERYTEVTIVNGVWENLDNFLNILLTTQDNLEET